MKGKTKNVSILPLAKGLRWPEPNEPVDEHFARLAVNKGNPAVLARYLRHHPRDIIILAIADMIDPSGKSTIKLVPKHRRGKGRPPKRKIRKHIESAIAEVRVAEKMGGKPIGTRGYTKRAVGEVKEETEQSERTIKRLIALRNK